MPKRTKPVARKRVVKKKRLKRITDRGIMSAVPTAKIAGQPWIELGGARHRLVDLARRSRLPIATVFRVFCAEGSRGVTWGTMRKIASAYHVSLDEVEDAILRSRALPRRRAMQILDRPEDGEVA